MVWAKISFDQANWQYSAFHLRGDTVFVYDPQKKRLLQILKRLHNATILNGKSAWAYNQSPSLVGFSENRCYIACLTRNTSAGTAARPKFRDKQSNAFFGGAWPIRWPSCAPTTSPPW